MKKKTYTVTKVSCYFHPTEGSTLDHCRGCDYFGGSDEGGVECLFSDLQAPEITSFTHDGYTYYLDKIESPNDVCQGCCFSKTLKNGNEVCLLKMIEIKDCGEDEVWKKKK